MKTKSMAAIRAGMKIGAVLGAMAFLAFGIVPGFHYGGYGTILLLGKLAGGSVTFTIGTRIVVILGVLLGILCAASMAIVIGSLVGTITSYLINAVKPVGAHQVK
jgi:hypothetical protein